MPLQPLDVSAYGLSQYQWLGPARYVDHHFIAGLNQLADCQEVGLGSPGSYENVVDRAADVGARALQNIMSQCGHPVKRLARPVQRQFRIQFVEKVAQRRRKRQGVDHRSLWLGGYSRHEFFEQFVWSYVHCFLLPWRHATGEKTLVTPGFPLAGTTFEDNQL